ncbi:MAG: class I SAM-dependent methyltransferase [Chitinophagaceae bacterium]|nr:class I SAM-dependent methyltransferase [Chitinophagaceae bacterium]
MSSVSKVRAVLSAIKSFAKHPPMFLKYKKYAMYTMFNHTAYIQNLLLLKKLAVGGCVVECGTWRGGMIAGWADILGNSREYYLFDSFEGLPEVTEKDGDAAKAYQIKTKEDPSFGWDNCRAEMSFADSAMKKAGIKNYHLVKGWFDETVPQFDKSKQIALLHLDGDWYDSIMVCLENLYDSVVEGGLVIIDDYTNWDGCSRAVHDFFSKRDVPERIMQFNNQITYFIKSPIKR